MPSPPGSNWRVPEPNSLFLCLLSGRQDFLLFFDQLRAFFLRERQYSLGSFWKPFIDQRMRALQLVFYLPRAQGIPALHGYPERPREMGSGINAVDFHQFVKTLGATVEPQHAVTIAIQ